MTVTGITDQMLQYGKATEVVYNNKPKHPKLHGIKRPEADIALIFHQFSEAVLGIL